MNSEGRFYIIYHLSSTLLLHYLVKFECSTTTAQNSHSIQKCVKSFIFSKYLQAGYDLDYMSMPIAACVQNIHHQHACML